MIPDSEYPRIHAEYTTPGLGRELSAGGIDISQLAAWGWKKEYALRRDKLYAQAACFLLEKKGINLLLVHFVSSDGVQHLFGPRTFAAYQVMAFEDRSLKQIWDTIRKPAFASNSALFVVSDHGFAEYEKLIEPNIVLKRRGLIELDGKGEVKQRRAWTVSNGGSAFIYLFDDKALSMSAELAAMLGKLEGVERGPQAPPDFAALGLPDPNENSPDAAIDPHDASGDSRSTTRSEESRSPMRKVIRGSPRPPPPAPVYARDICGRRKRRDSFWRFACRRRLRISTLRRPSPGFSKFPCHRRRGFATLLRRDSRGMMSAGSKISIAIGRRRLPVVDLGHRLTMGALRKSLVQKPGWTNIGRFVEFRPPI